MSNATACCNVPNVARLAAALLPAVTRDEDAKLLLNTMQTAGYSLRVMNPFYAALANADQPRMPVVIYSKWRKEPHSIVSERPFYP